ncbi:MAG: DUF2800 domain-containing protein [Alistipes sp.]
MSHSILAPSSANMWSKCGGWVVMSQSFPEPSQTTDAARIGTAAHEVAARYIESHARAKTYSPVAGELTDNDVTIDDEMLDACEMYADNVREVMIQTGVFGGSFLGVEMPLKMPMINDHMFGTADCVLIDTANKTAYVWDYKHGFDPVDVYENYQLISYAAGVIDYLTTHTPFLGSQNQDFKFVFRIVQPRAMHRHGPIREWSVTLAELRPYLDQLSQAATLAMSGVGQTQSGPHCRYCPARHACESAISAGVGLYEVAAQALPLDMTPDAVAAQLAIVTRASRQLESIKDALEQQVEALIKKGTNVRGYIAEPRRGRETWKDLDQVFALGDMLGVDLRKVSAVTPKQAEKLGIDGSVIKEYIHSPVTGTQIVPDNGNKAKLIFGAK